MKKGLILLVLTAAALALLGCDFIFGNTTVETIPVTSTTSEAATTTTTRTITVDMNSVISELYNRIYEDLYADVRAEVIADLSEAQFEAIYADVIADVYQLIEDGEITVTAESAIDLIYQVATTASTSVVGVTNLDAGGLTQSIGSGIIYKHVGDKYYVVTNQHVVENGASFEIQFSDGSTIDATLRGVDNVVDVAVLYFTSTDSYPVATFADSAQLKKGSIVLAVGNPNGYEFFNSVTMGIVSGLDRYFDINNDNVKEMYVNYVQHDASLNAGNSGGGLFNLDGEIVGINVIKIAATEIEGMGFAIPGNLVWDICLDIEEFGFSVQTPVLGIQFLDIVTQRAGIDSYGYVIPEGITAGFYVIGVVSGSSLDTFVLPGDIVTAIGDIVITNSTDSVAAFRALYRIGDEISVTVFREGSYVTLYNVILKGSVE